MNPPGGSSWIEVVVALGVLGWILVALGTTVTLGWHQLARGHKMLEALDQGLTCLGALEGGLPLEQAEGCTGAPNRVRILREAGGLPGLERWEVQVRASGEGPWMALRQLGFVSPGEQQP